MAGGIAHEFNNILVRIRASADLALMDLEEDPQSAREEIESIISGATDAARAVRRLEVLYQRADDLSDFVPLQLDALVWEALTLVHPRWRVQGFTDEEIPRVRTNLTQPPLVWGNPDELVHVLVRFLGNAIQAMPRGGTLSVATGYNHAWSFVTVSDTDRGIRSEVEGDAFEPFYTTRSHMADELGMVTAINIIERHGGETLVESKPGVGTSFTLRLPTAEGLDGDKGQ
jgi:signal transduction histidine kinase